MDGTMRSPVQAVSDLREIERLQATERLAVAPAGWQGPASFGSSSILVMMPAATIDTGDQVDFCRLYSPWQRRSNENINGLLRKRFSKGTGFENFTGDQLDAVTDSLNRRPRNSFGRQSRAEAGAHAIAMAVWNRLIRNRHPNLRYFDKLPGRLHPNNQEAQGLTHGTGVYRCYRDDNWIEPQCIATAAISGLHRG